MGSDCVTYLAVDNECRSGYCENHRPGDTDGDNCVVFGPP